MKTLLIFITVLSTNISSFSQGIAVKTKDGKEVTTTIRGITSKAILTGHGEFKLNEIDTVTFPSKMQKDQGTYDRLEAAGVTVAFLGAPIIPEPQQPQALEPALLTPAEHVAGEPVTVEQLAAALEAYRQTRQLGMTLELVGTVMMLVGAVVYTDEVNKETSTILVLGGGSLSLIGFTVSLGAGHHLRFDK